MSKQKIKNIIFDWSGTLSDDLRCVYGATAGLFKKLGLKKLTLDEYRKEYLLPYMNFYRKFSKLPKRQIDKIFLEEFVKMEEPEPFPESQEVLEFLNQNGNKLAILSSHFQNKLENEVKKYGFRRFFIDINGGIHDKRKAVKKVMKKNDFYPQETAFVGDMTHDIDAGKTAGIITVAVCWGYHSKKRLLSRKPDFAIDNLKEIKNIKLFSK